MGEAAYGRGICVEDSHPHKSAFAKHKLFKGLCRPRQRRLEEMLVNGLCIHTNLMLRFLGHAKRIGQLHDSECFAFNTR